MARHVAKAAIELVVTADAPLTTAVGAGVGLGGVSVGALVGLAVILLAVLDWTAPSQPRPMVAKLVVSVSAKVVLEPKPAASV